MSNRQSTARHRIAPASSLVDALGRDIVQIKLEDDLRWSDVGGILHVSEDQAAKYADGSATMNFVTFLRGKQAWNGRFTGTVDRLTGLDETAVDPHRAQSCLLKAALELSVALEDGDLSVDDVRASRATLENALHAIQTQLARLKPQGVSA